MEDKILGIFKENERTVGYMVKTRIHEFKTRLSTHVLSIIKKDMKKLLNWEIYILIITQQFDVSKYMYGQ